MGKDYSNIGVDSFSPVSFLSTKKTTKFTVYLSKKDASTKGKRTWHNHPVQ
jgi:hypothetical protein